MTANKFHIPSIQSKKDRITDSIIQKKAGEEAAQNPRSARQKNQLHPIHNPETTGEPYPQQVNPFSSHLSLGQRMMSEADEKHALAYDSFLRSISRNTNGQFMMRTPPKEEHEDFIKHPFFSNKRSTPE